MTTTDVYGYIECASGRLQMVYTNLTDAAAAAEVKAVDLAMANAQSLKDILRGETIVRMCMAVPDGSILTQLGIKKNGTYVYHTYGGERVASSNQSSNLDIWDLDILVDETTMLYAVTDE